MPYFSFDFQILIELKRESSLDQLHGPFQRDVSWSDDQVKMVRHDDKFMKQIFFLGSVIQQNFNKEQGNLLNLEKALLFCSTLAVTK